MTNGWYNGLTAQQQQYINDYTHRHNDESICQAMIRQLFATVNNTAIATMQDILDSPASSRMNLPSNDWWKLAMENAAIRFNAR